MFYRRLFSSLPSSLSPSALSLTTSRSFSRPFTHASSLKLSATSPSLARTRGGISHKDPDAPSDAPGLTPPITDGPVDALQDSILQLSRRLTEVLEQGEWADEATEDVVKHFQRVINDFLKVKAGLQALEKIKCALEDPKFVINGGEVVYWPQSKDSYRQHLEGTMKKVNTGGLSDADLNSLIERVLDNFPKGAFSDEPEEDAKTKKEPKPKDADKAFLAASSALSSSTRHLPLRFLLLV